METPSSPGAPHRPQGPRSLFPVPPEVVARGLEYASQSVPHHKEGGRAETHQTERTDQRPVSRLPTLQAVEHIPYKQTWMQGMKLGQNCGQRHEKKNSCAHGATRHVSEQEQHFIPCNALRAKHEPRTISARATPKKGLSHGALHQYTRATPDTDTARTQDQTPWCAL